MKLRDLINRNRTAFDHLEPPAGAWSKVWSVVASGNQRSYSLNIWRAAAIIFFGLSSYLYLSGDQTPVKRTEVTRLQGEFNDLESFYSSQIAERVAYIEDFEDSYDDDQFTQDVQKLEAMYQVLRDEMKSKPSEKVKDALILNMLVRIDLLNQQVKKLEEGRRQQKKDQSAI